MSYGWQASASYDNMAVRLQSAPPMNPFHCVYILQSAVDASKFYTGLTLDIDARLQGHNEGRSSWTAPHRPWKLLVSVEFTDEQTAIRFEKYLKTGSGRAFARRHFRPVG